VVPKEGAGQVWPAQGLQKVRRGREEGLWGWHLISQRQGAQEQHSLCAAACYQRVVARGACKERPSHPRRKGLGQDRAVGQGAGSPA